MRDDYNYQTETTKCVRGRWLRHDVYTHETLFQGKWYSEDDDDELEDAIDRYEYQRELADESDYEYQREMRADEARMEYHDQRGSAGEPD
jgi:hypothetical protein